MKNIIICVILLSACTHAPADLSKQAKVEIIKADKAMNEMASVKGFYEALLQYADSSVIKPQEGELPVIGKQQLAKYWQGKQEIKEIKWEPTLSDASASGDMGYTFGNWTYTTKDTTMHGNYITVWKKQVNGSWKFVYDGGNNTPNPLSK